MALRLRHDWIDIHECAGKCGGHDCEYIISAQREISEKIWLDQKEILK